LATVERAAGGVEVSVMACRPLEYVGVEVVVAIADLLVSDLAE
jgi:hypothetical protein